MTWIAEKLKLQIFRDANHVPKLDRGMLSIPWELVILIAHAAKKITKAAGG